MTWSQVAETPSTKKAERTTANYQVNVYPTTILIGPTGQIMHRGSGIASFEALKALLEKELATPGR